MSEMSEPFDLDAAVTETAGEPFRFTWGGGTFELQPILAMDIEDQLRLIDAIEKLDQANLDPADLLSVVKLIMGDALLAQMRERRPVGGAALMALVRQWIDHQGPALGKSAPSVPSSASTARRPKPTSRSTRARKTN